MIDETKLIRGVPKYPAFKNNREYRGAFVIDANIIDDVITTQVFEIQLNQAPDLCDIQFSGPIDTINPMPGQRPANSFFSDDSVEAVHTRINLGGSPYSMPWFLSPRIVGDTVIVTAFCFKTFTGAFTNTAPATVNYKIIDYSVF